MNGLVFFYLSYNLIIFPFISSFIYLEILQASSHKVLERYVEFSIAKLAGQHGKVKVLKVNWYQQSSELSTL